MCVLQCLQKNTACQHIFALNQTTNHHSVALQNHRPSRRVPPTSAIHAVMFYALFIRYTHVRRLAVHAHIFVYAHETRIWIYGKYQQDSSKTKREHCATNR